MKNKTLPGIILVAFFLFISLSGIAQVMINEYSTSNLNTTPDNYSEFEDWIELYNAGSAAVDLGGYYLSDDPVDSAKWVIPAGVTIQPGGFKLFWASGRDEASGNHLHTNFRLTQTKGTPETICLTDPSGTIIDQFQVQNTQKAHSRGRTTNGAGTWSIFTSATPGNSNNSSTPYQGYAERPVMNQVAGFYTSAITVTISTTEPNSVIRYTTNGTEPVSASTQYTTPINITETTLVKARVFSNNTAILPGLIEFNTYFINVSHSLPVLSLGADQLLNLLNGNSALVPIGSIEYFNLEGERTTTSYGQYNEHGQDSWVHPQRSIDHVTRDECGYNYALQEKFLSNSDRDEFQRLILRAAGDDNYPGIDTSAHTRDDFTQNYAQEHLLKLDVRKGARIVMYANGQFWGIYSIREKVHDHDFTEYYYNQGKYDIQFIMTWGSTWAEYGGQQALTDFNDLRTFILGNDMSQPENFSYVSSQYDYTSLVDYVIVNAFVVCSDWLNWNVGWWRGLNPEGTHRKWGYILWDEDAIFGHYINYTGVPGQHPYVPPCFPEDITSGWQDPGQHMSIMNKLRDNPVFDQYYISRYIDLYNTMLKAELSVPFLDSMVAVIEPEIQNHVNRWGGSYLEWQTNVQKVRNFIINRSAYYPEGMATCWGLDGPYDITVIQEPEGSGLVKLNSIGIKDFPWNGIYYGGVNVLLNAYETEPNYEFDKWVLNNHTVWPNDTSNFVTLSLTMGDTIRALFKPKEINDSIVINEIMYNSAPNFTTGDWVELYNPNAYSLDVAGWEFKDEDDEHIFTIPDNTVMDPNGYLVLCSDTAAFHVLFPDVTNYHGNMDFGLSGNGELIRVFDSTGFMLDFVTYDDELPWPLEPDGTGPSLELINPMYDNTLPQSWTASSGNGTPGQVNGPYTGIKDNPGASTLEVTVSPNPAKDYTEFTVNNGMNGISYTIEIYDVFGGLVYKSERMTRNKFHYTTTKLKPGMYFYRITDEPGEMLSTGKFLVE